MSCNRSCNSCGGCGGHSPQLSQRQIDFLNELAQVSYLPLCQFVLVPKGCYPQEGTVILSPVLLDTESDSLEEVMSTANLLVALARMKLISLDFDIPLSNYSYEIYYRSALFREFTANFKDRPEGSPVLHRGSMTITGGGLGYLEELG
jgi:hypothetical protein